MKIAVLSDIHGNLPGLEAVTKDISFWNPDQVIVNGDIINRGPCSQAVLQFVMEKQANEGWIVLRGNHEDYVLRCSQDDFQTSGPVFEINRFAFFAYQQLNGQIDYVAELPDRFSWFAPDSSEFRVVHASMRSNRDGIYDLLSDEELRKRIKPAPAVFVTGHTHYPMIRRVDQTLIVNAGSAGAPFDLDWRPSYARFTWDHKNGWQAEICRVEYDRLLTETDFVQSGFLVEGGPLAQLMLIELRKARGLIYRWGSQFEKAVIAGEISIEESVKYILKEDDVRPYLGPPGWVI